LSSSSSALSVSGVAGQNQGGLTSVGVVDPRAGHVNEKCDGLGHPGALFRQDGVQRLAITPQRTKGIINTRAPINPRDDAPSLALGTIAERALDDVRKTAVHNQLLGVSKGFFVRTCGKKTGAEVVFTNDPEVLRLYRPTVLLHRCEQLGQMGP